MNAKTGWTPNFSTIQTNSNDAPNQNFLAGAQEPRRAATNSPATLVTQTLPWGWQLRDRMGQLAIQLQQLVLDVLASFGLVRGELYTAPAA